jgi:pimeloyl-ACP methyl ester carboxylesterase
LASTYLAQFPPSSTLTHPFKLAIFLSGVSPVSPSALQAGDFRKLNVEEDGEVITIPTAHVYGMRDERFPGSSAVLERLCKGEKRAVFVHDGGHPIPAGKRELGEMVKVVRRAIHWGGGLFIGEE